LFTLIQDVSLFIVRMLNILLLAAGMSQEDAKARYVTKVGELKSTYGMK